VHEELGAKITDVVPCFVDTVEHIGADGGATGVKVQHFFVCRLESMDPSLRHGPEIDEPCGEYEIVRCPSPGRHRLRPSRTAVAAALSGRQHRGRTGDARARPGLTVAG
jgi:hypothetical protein